MLGFTNSGTQCFFNALIQSLISCDLPRSNNPLLQEFHKIIKEKKNDTIEIFTLLCKLQKRPTILRQEDAHEFLLFFIESADLKERFYIRHICRIHCHKCQKLTNNISYETCPPELSFECFSTENLNEHIKINYKYPEDYKCECGAQNKDNQIIVQTYKLALISDILVVTFKKYLGKKIIPFPLTMEFPGKVGTFNYELVAQIEHFGNSGLIKSPAGNSYFSSGHYTARCLREINGKKEVFNFNDTSVSPSKFEPTAETYILFYRKLK
ncbi:MAG: hypothetical protein QW303_07365 [Nitrososphaerota archaeon]